MTTTFQQELEKVPVELRPMIESNQDVVRLMLSFFKTFPAHNDLIGFEMMVQGYAMLTGQTEEHSRDVMADGFVQALRQAAAQLSRKPGNA